MKKFVIVVAGGKGLRMGGDLPKQFIPMRGKPLLMHTLEAFYSWDETVRVVLVLPADHQAYWQMLCREIGCPVPHRVVTGGETRFHSVLNGLKEVQASLGGEEALVAVHDGVRPFVSAGTIEACFREAEVSGAAIPVLPMIDSLRRQTADGGSEPVDRSRYFQVQTPQVFRASLLLNAYAQPYQSVFTDDASVVEACGIPVKMVEGNRENIKITTPFDLTVARAVLGE